MAIIRDMMPGFELFQPTSVEGAVELLGRYGEDSWVLAGGLDSFDWLKDRIKRPTAVIDLGGIAELRGVRATDQGVEIGAMTTLSDVVSSPLIRERYSLLADAASHVATPQIRNAGTLGGNLCQDTRCWYYRSGWPCYRAGGNICYASAPDAMHREHAILGARRCVAVSPSDTAPALLALGASMVFRSTRGERVVDAEDFFIGPAIDITRMTILKPGDLLTAIRIPGDWAGVRFYFEKVRERQSWDFALASVASALDVQGGVIRRARIAVNGVAPYPVRLAQVERAVVGATLDEDTARRAGDLAIQGTRPLPHNEYKQPLMRNLVRRALRA
jgi:xanthine dehydrogenase YagS FAD-binding subunit